MRKLEFYFDYLSPYAYFAWNNIDGFCRANELDLILKPIVFGKLLDHWGHLGPAEIPPKRDWLVKHCVRYASQHKILLGFPRVHPFNSLTALRLSLKEVSQEAQKDVVGALFKSSWGLGMDIGDDGEMIKVLNSMGLDGQKLIEKTKENSVKDILKSETERAIAKGVFGIPSMIIEDELFWGNDQFEFMQNFVSGNENLDDDKISEILSRNRAIDRKVIKTTQQNSDKRP